MTCQTISSAASPQGLNKHKVTTCDVLAVDRIPLQEMDTTQLAVVHEPLQEVRENATIGWTFEETGVQKRSNM